MHTHSSDSTPVAPHEPAILPTEGKLSSGPQDLTALMEDLAKDDSEIVLAALNTIAQMGTLAEPLIPVLIHMLKSDPDANVRTHVARALSHVGEAAVSPLLDALQVAVDDDFRAGIITSIGMVGISATNATSTLEKFASDGETGSWIRERAWIALSRIDGRKVSSYPRSEGMYRNGIPLSEWENPLIDELVGQRNLAKANCSLEFRVVDVIATETESLKALLERLDLYGDIGNQARILAKMYRFRREVSTERVGPEADAERKLQPSPQAFVTKYNIGVHGDSKVSFTLPPGTCGADFLFEAQDLARKFFEQAAVSDRLLVSCARTGPYTEVQSTARQISVDGAGEATANERLYPQLVILKERGVTLATKEDCALAAVAYFIATGERFSGGRIMRVVDGALQFEEDGLTTCWDNRHLADENRVAAASPARR